MDDDPNGDDGEPTDDAVLSPLLAELPETDRVVGFWPMEGDALDHSPSGFHGTNMGGVEYSTERKRLGSQAALFDGENDYLDFGDNLDLLHDDFTISTWIRVDSRDDSPSLHPIVDKLQRGGNFRMHLTAGGKYAFGLRDEDEVYQQFASDMVSEESKWVHFLFTFEKDLGIKIYLNGKPDADRGPFSITRGDTGTSLRIGYTSNNEQYFKGAIDDVAIWDTGLTSESVLGVYTVQGRYFDQE